MDDPAELWPDAVPLRDAWWILGEEDQRHQYRQAGRNPALTGMIETLMRRDLLYRINEGDLLCLGIQISPILGDKPEILSKYLFGHPEVDWANSAVVTLGRAYGDVKVAQPQSVTSLSEAGTPSTTETVAVGSAGIPSGKDIASRKIGAPRKIDKVREVIREFAAAGQLNGLLRKEQIYLVQLEARERFPSLFLKPSHPSRNTVLAALIEEGF